MRELLNCRQRRRRSQSTPSLCFLSVASCLLLLLFFVDFGCAINSSNNNYNVYNYDMTTPQFTPDGRLLQVEYASSAAGLSSPIVALQFSNDMDSSDGNDKNNNKNDNDNPDVVLVLIALRSSNTQSRIVLLEEEDDDDGNHPNKKSGDIAIAMSGILSDNIALLQAVRKRNTQNMQQYKKPLNMFGVASSIADACQRHSFGGGIRPYGSTMLICGFDSTSNSNAGREREASIYQTDPSGGIQEVPTTIEDSEGEDTTTTKTKIPEIRWIVGGSPSMQRQLRKRLSSDLSIISTSRRQRKQHNESETPTTTSSSSIVVDSIAIVARTLIKETKQQQPQAKRKKNDDNDDHSPPSFEVVVLSSTLGSHRLSSDQLDVIRNRI